MKILGYIVTGVVSALGASVGTYFVTKKVVSKKLKEKYEEENAKQLNECREYYKRRFMEATEIIEDKEYDDEDDAKKDNGIKQKIVITDPDEQKKKNDNMNQTLKSYHKMYGSGGPVESYNEDEEDEYPPVKTYEREQPYPIRKSQMYDEYEDYDKVQFIYYTGDVLVKKNGEKTYVPVLYSDGYIESVNGVDKKWNERAIKLTEIEKIIGHEWKSLFGDDSYDDETGDGFDFDSNECVIANDKMKMVFMIKRDDKMYKCAVENCEPGDDFDYSKVR